MPKTALNKFLIILLVFLFSLLAITYKSPKFAVSATNHVVISEVQIEGTTATDEFIELYNPLNSAVDLSGWSLKKKTASGASELNVIASMTGTIAAKGFFLIAHPNYDGSITADQPYSATGSANSIAANNTIILRDASDEIVDKLGMGTAQDNETTAFPNIPDNEQSIERKASSTSTTPTLATGGSEATAGNGEDTDNNASDFVLQTIANPQNSASAAETSAIITSPTPNPTPSPTIQPSVSPSPTAVPSTTPNPSIDPTPSASPSISPSPSASASPITSVSPTPTASTSPTPTVSPSPSPIASASPTPSISPTPSPSSDIIFSGVLFTCRMRRETRNFGFFSIRIPRISCSRNS